MAFFFQRFIMNNNNSILLFTIIILCHHHFVGANDICNNLIRITISNSPKLGLRLSEGLTILEFVPLPTGAPSELQASNSVQLFDKLISVNDISLENKRLSTAVSILREQELPMRLVFCNNKTPEATSTTTRRLSITPGTNGVGYLVLDSTDTGVPEYTLAFAALYNNQVSAPLPSCNTFISFVKPHPAIACSPITERLDDSFAFISSSGGCPLYEKVMHAQEAHATGVIIVVENPQTVATSLFNNNDTAPPLGIPVILVTKAAVESSSSFLLTKTTKYSRRSSSPQIRLLFTTECIPETISNRKTSRKLTKSSNLSGTLVINDGEFHVDFVKIFDSSPRTLEDLVSTPIVVLKDTCNERTHDPDAFRDKILVIPLEDSCSISDYIGSSTYASAAAAIVFATLDGPTTRQTVDDDNNNSMTLLSISSAAYEKLNNPHLILSKVIFDNALQHQWEQLSSLIDPTKWPASTAGRQKLYNRLVKSVEKTTKTNAEEDRRRLSERHSHLNASFNAAQEYHQS